MPYRSTPKPCQAPSASTAPRSTSAALARRFRRVTLRVPFSDGASMRVSHDDAHISPQAGEFVSVNFGRERLEIRSGLHGGDTAILERFTVRVAEQLEVVGMGEAQLHESDPTRGAFHVRDRDGRDL